MQSPSSHDFLENLEKSLEKHNEMDDPETSDPDLKDDEDKITSGNRLWAYFLENSSYLTEKVEQ